jgi:hypothetical protein
MFNTKSVDEKVFRITYSKRYAGEDTKCFVYFAFSYNDLKIWVDRWQSEIVQIICIEEYVIEKNTERGT